ncbi:MAG TPA: ATP-binding protein [Planctomycetota bacterium]|nr:ATP-binding protein [Planctomycetota bacterium]
MQKVQDLNTNLEERVTERTQRLRSAIRELEAFSYTIAHDLRTPLRAIHRFSEILVSEYGPRIEEQGQHYARQIVSGAEKMDTLINDLLEYSRLTQSELHFQMLHPEDTATEALKGLLSGHAGRAPEVVIDRNLPEVDADRILLHQVFLNFLSNALKFVGKDVQPKVRVSGERRGAHVLLSMSDNGIGIPPELQGRLFRVFERLGDSRNDPGTGIRLAIVRRAVERMEGECGVESEVGKGSRFWVRLPSTVRDSGGAS